ncbi:MAG: dethiobiotin synthase [Sulfurimonas sp.]|nr:MAG: dethiobiotin synthase [Sulfurimonas sp.]
MTKRIFVTATNTDIGKTYTTKLLLKEFSSRGIRVGVIKPIETGVDEIAYDGVELLECVQALNSEFMSLKVNDIVPITYKLAAAPYISSNKKNLDLNKLDLAIKKIENLCDILIIEGAGGLYVPIDEKYKMIDLISYFKATTLLVTHCSLGCINDTLLSEKALKDLDINFITAFNCNLNSNEFSKISEPYFLDTKKDVLKVDENIDTICDVLYNF